MAPVTTLIFDFRILRRYFGLQVGAVESIMKLTWQDLSVFPE